MKKVYETPKVVKMAFNYSEAVVASNNSCYWSGEWSYGYEGCKDSPDYSNGEWHSDNT